MTKRYLKTPEEIVKELKLGKEVISDTFEHFKYKMLDGIICRYNGACWILNDRLDSSEKFYVEEPELLKLEVGKFYKTRDGRKAFVYTKAGDERYPYWVVVVNSSEGGTYCCTVDGEYSTGREDPLDLVAPWED